MTSSQLSRQTILDRLRTKEVAAEPLPTIDPKRLVQYEDPVAKFTEILTWIGGRVHQVKRRDVANVLERLPEYSSARWIASTVPDTVAGNFHLDQVDDPHSLVSVDWSVLSGEFAVAENGAIWVQARSLNERTLIFIAQHLAIVVPRTQIVMHMHTAYQRIEATPVHQGAKNRFGVFVSGPSKTADIEQSLVLGAHGCRTLEVFLVD